MAAGDTTDSGGGEGRKEEGGRCRTANAREQIAAEARVLRKERWAKGAPDMMSASEGGGGPSKVDMVRDKSAPNADKAGGGQKIS